MKAPFKILAATAAALVLGASALQAAPAPKVIIEDPLGDANFVNDQGTGDGSFGDQTAADAGTVSDLLGIAVSNDAKNLYVDFKTEAAPPATTGIGYRLRVNPDGSGGAYCVLIEVFYPGANNLLTAGQGHVVDTCAGGDPVPVEVLGTHIIVPRDATDAFKKGATLTAPQAQAFLYSGDYPNGSPTGTADTTLVGTDYKMVDKKAKKKK